MQEWFVLGNFLIREFNYLIHEANYLTHEAIYLIHEANYLIHEALQSFFQPNLTQSKINSYFISLFHRQNETKAEKGFVSSGLQK
jgi:hypothetical protein